MQYLAGIGSRMLIMAAIVVSVAPTAAADEAMAIDNPGFERLAPEGAIVGWQLVVGESSAERIRRRVGTPYGSRLMLSSFASTTKSI